MFIAKWSTYFCKNNLSVLGVYSKTVYVKQSGSSDSVNCGSTELSACDSISVALSKTSHNDIIQINASSTHQVALIHCAAFPIMHSVTIKGVNGRAKIGCSDNTSFILDFQNFSPLHPNTTLENLHFVIGGLLGKDMTLNLINCYFSSLSAVYIMLKQMVHIMGVTDLALGQEAIMTTSLVQNTFCTASALYMSECK